jgi:RimJ/RimL family protein N-acetyltransferase
VAGIRAVDHGCYGTKGNPSGGEASAGTADARPRRSESGHARARNNPSMRPPRPTERLAFREMTVDDLDAMSGLLGDREVMAFYPHPFDRAETVDWIEWNRRLYRQHGFGLWVVEQRDGGLFVGDCGLTPQEVDGRVEIEVGYHVRGAFQRRGYATEAAAATRDHARDILGLDRLIAIIDPGNVASQRVAEKIGLSLEKVVDRKGRPMRIYAGRI